MESPEMETQEMSENILSGREGGMAFFAQEEIAALARGIVPHADLAFPWPPPSYVWPRRSAKDILAQVKERRGQKQSARDRVLSLGSQVLDEKLSRCFAFGSLVEIVGQAGTGKTQFALTLTAETIIQLYNSHKEYTPCCECKDPFLPSFSGSFDNTTEEPGRCSHNKDAETHIEDSRHHLPSDRRAVKDMKNSVGPLNKPAVVYYLHTEGAFPVKRLHEIVLHRQHRRILEGWKKVGQCRHACRDCRVCPADTADDAHAKLLMQRVFTEEISSEEQLWLNLTRRLPRLTIHHRLALVVIDSIAAIFRPTALDSVSPVGLYDCSCVETISTQRKFNSSNHVKAKLVDRASKLLRIGSLLRRLSTEHDFCCLILNQVSDTVKDQLPLSSNPLDFDVGVSRTDYLTPYAENDMEGVHATTLSETSAESRRVRVSRQTAPCCSDGRYCWNTRNSHGPIFENIGVQPSLGLTWGNCLNCRMMLHKFRTNATSSTSVYAAGGAGETPLLLRRCRVVFGNDANISRDIIFQVDATGVVEA